MSNYMIIALTGGSGGGKTDIMNRLKTDLNGICNVVFIPETATELLAKGYVPEQTLSLFDFQEMIFVNQLKKETDAINNANTPTIIICDRTLIDGSAFVESNVYNDILYRHGQTLSNVLNRYDLVVHLMSPAVDAPEFYQKMSNIYRMENEVQARLQDARLLACYNGHKNRYIYDNHGGYDAKINGALNIIKGEIIRFFAQKIK